MFKIIKKIVWISAATVGAYMIYKKFTTVKNTNAQKNISEEDAMSAKASDSGEQKTNTIDALIKDFKNAKAEREKQLAQGLAIDDE